MNSNISSPVNLVSASHSALTLPVKAGAFFFFLTESALRGTRRNTPSWSLLASSKALLVSPRICSQMRAQRVMFCISRHTSRDSGELFFVLPCPLLTVTLKPLSLPERWCLLRIFLQSSRLSDLFPTNLLHQRMRRSSVPSLPPLPSTVSRSQIQFLPEAQDDPQRRRPDIRKAKMMLGWEPVVRVRRAAAYCPARELTTFCTFNTNLHCLIPLRAFSQQVVGETGILPFCSSLSPVFTRHT